MGTHIRRSVAVLGLLVACAVAVWIVGAVVAGDRDGDANEAVLSSPRPIDADDDGGDDDDDDDDEDNDVPPTPLRSGESPDQATLTTRVVVKGGDDDDEDGDGSSVGDNPPTSEQAAPQDGAVVPAPQQSPSDGSAAADEQAQAASQALLQRGIDVDTPTPSPLTPDTPTPSPLTPDSPDTPDTPLTDPTEVSDITDLSNNADDGADGVVTRPLARSTQSTNRTRRPRRAPPPGLRLTPEVEFPDDPALPQLGGLFDPAWIWDVSADCLSDTAPDPTRLHVRHFSHSPGKAATASYEALRAGDDWMPSVLFNVTVGRGAKVSVTRFPHDDALPGLAPAVDPSEALRLVDRHVFTVPRRVMATETVRYRPSSRAVLRHITRRFKFYARVVRPAALPEVLAAAQIVSRSQFTVPPVVGCWNEGGVLWVPEVPGTNLRDSVRLGTPVDPDRLLADLHSIWSLPASAATTRPFNLAGAFARAQRTFGHALRDDLAGQRLLRAATETLGGFVAAWEPSSAAHNDFYDDQLIAMADGRIALVDFEEAGPGDPMLDVGNFLAHLAWAAADSPLVPSDARPRAYDDVKHAALERFGWNRHDLAMREAVCLFRICTNTVRRIKPDWAQRTRDGLTLTLDTVG